MTLILDRLVDIVKVHVYANFHQAKSAVHGLSCWQSTMLKTILPSLPRAVKTED